MLGRMTEAAELDARAGFAGLMARAAEAAAPEGADPEAPYGWTTDPDGTRRPKKAAGRPSRRQKALEELKAEREAAPDAAGPGGPAVAGDRPPDASRRRKPRLSRGGADAKPKSAPQFREGQIERGINQLYRKTGRLVRVADADIGQALIDITRKDDPEDVTVGEAWEQLARTNPRVRAFLLRLMAGGAWSGLLMAHAPVFMAVLMKDAVRSRLPFGRLVDAALTPDEDGRAPADGTPLDGLQPQDMQQMMQVAREFAERAMNGPRTPVPDA